jgi:hypothetical protein
MSLAALCLVENARLGDAGTLLKEQTTAHRNTRAQEISKTVREI